VEGKAGKMQPADLDLQPTETDGLEVDEDKG